MEEHGNLTRTANQTQTLLNVSGGSSFFFHFPFALSPPASGAGPKAHFSGRGVGEKLHCDNTTLKDQPGYGREKKSRVACRIRGIESEFFFRRGSFVFGAG